MPLCTSDQLGAAHVAMFPPEVSTEIPQADSNSTELTTWDFLQGLDFGPEPDAAIFPVPQDSSGVKASNSERLKEKNRKAQKRFRERKKERTQTTEAQLAEATLQLHNLRLKQRELEARNNLLEKIATLNKQQTLPDSSHLSTNTQDAMPDSRQAAERDFFLEILERSGLRRTQQGAAIILTGRDMEEEVLIDDLAVIRKEELLNLKKAYVHKMAQCLLDISDDHESKSHLDLQRYSLEMAACFVCCWMTTAHKAAAAVTESLSLRDDVCPLQHEGLPNKLYKDLLVALQYTEAQEQDLLHLRRLFYGKLGQLARERAALLSKMPAACNVAENNEPISFHLGYRHVADQFALTKEVSDQLCANHAEESSVYMAHGFCLFRCIHSSIQHATLMVNSYPRPVDPNTLLEILAQQYDEPSIEVLMSADFKDDLQHAANWDTIEDYMSSLTAEKAHEHCPLLQRSSDISI